MRRREIHTRNVKIVKFIFKYISACECYDRTGSWGSCMRCRYVPDCSYRSFWFLKHRLSSSSPLPPAEIKIYTQAHTGHTWRGFYAKQDFLAIDADMYFIFGFGFSLSSLRFSFSLFVVCFTECITWWRHSFTVSFHLLRYTRHCLIASDDHLAVSAPTASTFAKPHLNMRRRHSECSRVRKHTTPLHLFHANRCAKANNKVWPIVFYFGQGAGHVHATQNDLMNCRIKLIETYCQSHVQGAHNLHRARAWNIDISFHISSFIIIYSLCHIMSIWEQVRTRFMGPDVATAPHFAIRRGKTKHSSFRGWCFFFLSFFVSILSSSRINCCFLHSAAAAIKLNIVLLSKTAY